MEKWKRIRSCVSSKNGWLSTRTLLLLSFASRYFVQQKINVLFRGARETLESEGARKR